VSGYLLYYEANPLKRELGYEITRSVVRGGGPLYYAPTVHNDICAFSYAYIL